MKRQGITVMEKMTDTILCKKGALLINCFTMHDPQFLSPYNSSVHAMSARYLLRRLLISFSTSTAANTTRHRVSAMRSSSNVSGSVLNIVFAAGT